MRDHGGTGAEYATTSFDLAKLFPCKTICPTWIRRLFSPTPSGALKLAECTETTPEPHKPQSAKNRFSLCRKPGRRRLARNDERVLALDMRNNNLENISGVSSHCVVLFLALESERRSGAIQKLLNLKKVISPGL
jgi:hypothetical protein